MYLILLCSDGVQCLHLPSSQKLVDLQHTALADILDLACLLAGRNHLRVLHKRSIDALRSES